MNTPFMNITLCVLRETFFEISSVLFYLLLFMGFDYYNCIGEVCYRSISRYIFQFLISAIFV